MALRSTESALLLQKEIILGGFERRLYLIGIFVDYSKAFDRINHTALLKKPQHYCFRGAFFTLMQSYLSDRQQQVQLNNYKSSFRSLNSGVLQGSILGPLLFTVYINGVVRIYENTQFVVYADDTSFFFFLDQIYWKFKPEQITYSRNCIPDV